jgi:hypothetical protein
MSHLSTIVEIPIGWILTSIGILCGTITTLGVTVFQILRNRLDAQDKVLEFQERQIESLKADVLRLSQGCGADACHWLLKVRGKIS